jgi:hypothetical protein
MQISLTTELESRVRANVVSGLYNNASKVSSPVAENDLKEFYPYGLRQWGKAQSDHSLATVKDQF